MVFGTPPLTMHQHFSSLLVMGLPLTYYLDVNNDVYLKQQ